jgi:hypothetical protein
LAWFLANHRRGADNEHHWLVVACDSCQTITEMDLSMKPRDPDAPIRVALDDVRVACAVTATAGGGLARSHWGLIDRRAFTTPLCLRPPAASPGSPGS